MSNIRETRILQLLQHAGAIRPRDLDQYGIPRTYLARLVEKGLLLKVGRGLYTGKDYEPTEKHSLAKASKLVPHGILCLLSALQFHDLTTQSPHEVWMAIGEKTWKPKVEFPKIRFHRFSGKALTQGIEKHVIEGVPMQVFNIPKTVADCFKYRNKIGLDVAMEALGDVLRRRKCKRDDLYRFGKICRVANIMRPYMEAMA